MFDVAEDQIRRTRDEFFVRRKKSEDEVGTGIKMKPPGIGEGGCWSLFLFPSWVPFRLPIFDPHPTHDARREWVVALQRFTMCAKEVQVLHGQSLKVAPQEP